MERVLEVNNSYQLFYSTLSNLREEFHRNGRLDDSNAKLDEIIKLIVLNYYESKNSNNRFNLEYIMELAKKHFDSKHEVAKALRFLFEEVVQNKMFFNNDGTNIFGSNPTLSIQPSENEFASNLINEISKIDFNQLLINGESQDFDIINEFFGHFVRDNFRNNKEDGQYMTPQEIIYPVLDMVFHDILKDDEFETTILNGDFKILDPTCGVGTLIIEPLRHIQNYVNKLAISHDEKEIIIQKIKQNGLIGQDKVDRMVRLSKINMLLFGGNIANIFHGNSITNGSELDNYNSQIDLIITNPPFGAVHKIEELVDQERYSIINKLNENYNNIDSELIMLDRCISLLKPNGKLVIVVPDSVVSAKGIYGAFREELLRTCDIKAVIDMPSVTFAQAGTRTKCVILYLEKKNTTDNNIFISICNDIGYDVKERKGVPVKIQKGINAMKEISQTYIQSSMELKDSNSKIELLKPSCAVINQDKGLTDNFLTPNFYKADRINTLKILESLDKDKFEVKELREIVDFDVIKRKRLNTTEDIKHVSVLHVNPDSTINFEDVEEFEPVSKGKECFKGEILFSKINPRISRIAVVPAYEKKLVCSNEFEVLAPKQNVNPHLIMLMLNMDIVKKQIINLTSGTSSSHNRIKAEQLGSILLPFPKPTGEMFEQFKKLGDTIEATINKKYAAEFALNIHKNDLDNLIK
ncbi:N-6 DNA methylase [Bacillus sp. H-16]|uniref:N-6 DNA methylase n=1 Tax=Alteribacter salitolerans TaxID=2912333 RepID=UPI0019623DD0|nr:N-6 DNA methylase [Alteribacter salitolerans]MBM7094793.1 N-6 DNA methylase [Alteribacter salitolerans]